MVYVAVFVPSSESLYLVTQQARRFQSSQIHVDVLHRFGTQPLDDLDKYDMIVARGITYRQICARYPQKHIIHLDFDGADIVEALLRCREQFSPRHIALCLERRGLEDLLPDLEALCEAEIRLYDVVDGESAVEAPLWPTVWTLWCAPVPSATSVPIAGTPVSTSAPEGRCWRAPWRRRWTRPATSI